MKVSEERLAIDGGAPVRTRPLPRVEDGSGRMIGDEELALLREVIESGSLNKNYGTMVKRFQEDFSEYLGVKHAVMSTSGTAAIHIALGAIQINPGDEVITSPITDMGTVVPILLQNAVPVFADIDPNTFTMDPEDLRKRLTSRTRAIIPVHLAGNPCDMDAIMKIAEKHGLRVIEDCCQALGAEYKGRLCGTIGHLGAFSFNQSKQITCGDGGMTVTNDPELAERALLFSDKGWPRGGTGRDHVFLAPNYRVTELQGAVCIAQLKKLPKILANRRRACERLEEGLEGCPLVGFPKRPEGHLSARYSFPMMVPEELQAPFGKALRAEGIPCGMGYLDKAIYLYGSVAKKRTYGTTSFPYDCPAIYDGEIEYVEGLCPVAEKHLRETLVFIITEKHTNEDIDDMVTAVRKVASALAASR